MAETSRSKLTAILWFVAAALSLTAALLHYTEDGTIKWPLWAAALFLGAVGVSSLRRG